jgi:hypothetical protein
MQSVLSAADAYFADPASPSPTPGGKQPSRAAAAQAQSFTATSKDAAAGFAPDTTLVEAHAVLSAYERAIAVTPGQDRLELRVSANDIDCSVAGKGDTGAALEVWDIGRGTLASVMMAANRCTARSVAPTVRVMRVMNASMTGNIVRNAQKGGYSVSVLPASPAVAVTGNILAGPPLLPARPLPAPFDDWGPLNTVVT